MQEIPEKQEPTLGYPDSDGAEGTAPGESRPAGEMVSSPEEMLKKAELAAQEHHDAWLRAKAETDNVRRRAQVEVANAHKFALESFAGELLPVKDSLEAALATETPAVEGLKSGVELTLKQLKSVFDKFNLVEINPAREKFDPHRHQAISAIESDAAPNTVLQVLQKGYLLNDRVLRPALVTVAKSKNVEN